jgi:SPP1 family predicted phage head-tail adaptor
LIGLMNQRVTLEYPTLTRDAYGGQVTTWTQKSVVWAKVDYMRQGQEFDRDRIVTESTITIKTHYRSDITDAWRVKWGEKYYNVRRVDNTDRRRRWTVIEAVEGDAF